MGLSSVSALCYHGNRGAVAAVSLVPVTGAVTRDDARLANHNVIRAVVANNVKITAIEPLNPVIPDQPLSLRKYFVVNIVSTHSVNNLPNWVLYFLVFGSYCIFRRFSASNCLDAIMDSK